jgi:hypothetical protein
MKQQHLFLQHLMNELAALIDARVKYYEAMNNPDVTPKPQSVPSTDLLHRRYDDFNRVLDQIDMQFVCAQNYLCYLCFKHTFISACHY